MFCKPGCLVENLLHHNLDFVLNIKSSSKGEAWIYEGNKQRLQKQRLMFLSERPVRFGQGFVIHTLTAHV